MLKKNIHIIIFILMLAISLSVSAQDNVWEDLLKQEVEVLNPVKKPVIGIGVGTLNFFGDVKNNYTTPSLGNFGYKLNVMAYIDSKRYFKTNFSFLFGKVGANQTSFTDLNKNLNFLTDVIVFGLNAHYDFGHLLSSQAMLKPYIALGIENIQFNPKGDLLDANGRPYYFWTDGSIRNKTEGSANVQIVNRDYKYESNLREKNLYGAGDYSKNTFAIPVDFGLEWVVSYRMAVRLGATYHYTFSDNLDNVSSKGDKAIGDSKKDKFLYTYLSLHLDLFSDPKTITQEKLFADVDFDYAMYGDEDNDMVFDGWDQCPGTPKNVEVDTLGCPFDGDIDGVANYKDKELESRPNSIVNRDGVEITDDEVISFLENGDGVKRKDVELYLKLYSSMGARSYKRKNNLPVPDKFKKIDLDNDGYVSFEEVLKAINDFFDFESDFTNQEIYELNEFFFAQ